MKQGSIPECFSVRFFAFPDKILESECSRDKPPSCFASRVSRLFACFHKVLGFYEEPNEHNTCRADTMKSPEGTASHRNFCTESLPREVLEVLWVFNPSQS